MRHLSLLLAGLLVLDPAWSQSNPPTSVAPDFQGPYKIRVVDDPGTALPNSTALKGFAVQVTDSTGAPVPGVAVALRLPEEGATGHFPNNLRAWVAYSDPAGLARFPVIQWEGSVGSSELHLTAAKAGVHTTMLVKQEVAATGHLVPPTPDLPAPVLAASTLAASNPAASNPVEPAVPKPAPPPAPEIALDLKPGTVSKPLAAVMPLPASKTGASPSIKAATPTETHHTLTPNPPPPASGVSSASQTGASGRTGASTSKPTVTITNSKTGGSALSRNKKWIIIAAVGAAAGAGALLALHGHGSSSSAASTAGISIGSPTVTVGH
jgi:hypothetical protein